MCCKTLFVILITLLAIMVIWYILYRSVLKISKKITEEVEMSKKIEKFVFGLNVSFSAISVAIPIIVILASIFSMSLAGKNLNTTDFYTAFIALCTTFVVGFQIYNSIDLNRRIEKLDAKKNELEEQIKKFDKLYKRSYYFNAYNVGAIYFNQTGINQLTGEARKRYCWNSLRAYFNALCSAAEGGQDFDKAIKAFGDSRMMSCIQTLNEIHNDNSCGEQDGDDISAMPKYDDRIHYITKIQDYISKINKLLENLKKNTFILK